jgi:hypothetical protein
MKLFMYAVWFKGDDQGKNANVIIAPGHLLANDLEAAKLTAATMVPAGWEDALATGRVEVAVVPFVQKQQ